MAMGHSDSLARGPEGSFLIRELDRRLVADMAACVDAASWKRWLDTEPTLDTQQALLDELAIQMAFLIAEQNLPWDFDLSAGLRLRSKFGTCRFDKNGRAKIQVRCTKGMEPLLWRKPGAIVVTFLHELAHLKHLNHGARFWRFLRRLVDQAHAMGLYEPAQDDGDEGSAGDIKLAGSAASGLAAAAHRRRRARWKANRDALTHWSVGDCAFVSVSPARAMTPVNVVALGRTCAHVVDEHGQRYLVPAGLLSPETYH